MRKTVLGLLVGAGLSVVAGPASADEAPGSGAGYEKALVVKPVAGAAVIKPMKPDWCARYVRKDRLNAGLYRETFDFVRDSIEQQQLSQDRILHVHGYEGYQKMVGNAACEWPDDPLVQEQVAYWRQLSVNVTGLSDAEDRRTLAVLIGPQSEQMQHELLTKFNKEWPFSLKDPIARTLAEVERTLLYGKDALTTPTFHVPDNVYTYMLDTPGRPTSPVERALYAYSHRDIEKGGADARRIDVAAIDAEMKKKDVNELAQMRAHVYAVFTKTRYQRDEAKLIAEDAKAPTFNQKKYTLDHPESAFANWEKDYYTPHQADMDAMRPVEMTFFADWDRNQRARQAAEAKEVPANCKGMRQKYLAAVAALKPKSADDVDLRVNLDPWVEYLREHAALCETYAKNYLDSWAFMYQLRDAQVSAIRGPRSAMYAANFDDLQEQNKLHIGGLNMGRAPDPLRDELTTAPGLDRPGNWKPCDSSDCHDPGGRIAAVKKDPAGDYVITFKNEKVWYQTMVCKESHARVRRILSDGKIEWEPDCHGGPWVQKTIQQDPLYTNQDDASLLKPGQAVRFITATRSGDFSHNGAVAFPVEISRPAAAKGKQDTLLYYALIPVSGGGGGGDAGSVGGKSAGAKSAKKKR